MIKIIIMMIIIIITIIIIIIRGPKYCKKEFEKINNYMYSELRVAVARV